MEQEIKINPELVTVARISHSSGIIEVCSYFYSFDKEVQDLIVFTLQFYRRTNEWFMSDIKAIQKAKKLYPEKSNEYWIKQLARVFEPELSKELIQRLGQITNYLLDVEKHGDPTKPKKKRGSKSSSQ